MRASLVFVIIATVLYAADSFTSLVARTNSFQTTTDFRQHKPRQESNGVSPISALLMSSSNNDPLEVFGPLRFIPPALFVGQICFLTAANLVSGIENLEEYGRLGNVYIRSHQGYDQSLSLLERQKITSQGQKVWFLNVVRDLQNGAPVVPPISEP